MDKPEQAQPEWQRQVKAHISPPETAWEYEPTITAHTQFAMALLAEYGIEGQPISKATILTARQKALEHYQGYVDSL